MADVPGTPIHSPLFAGSDTFVAAPGFADLPARDFTLSEESPALAIGFEPTDLSEVGPRPKDARE